MSSPALPSWPMADGCMSSSHVPLSPLPQIQAVSDVSTIHRGGRRVPATMDLVEAQRVHSPGPSTPRAGNFADFAPADDEPVGHSKCHQAHNIIHCTLACLCFTPQICIMRCTWLYSFDSCCWGSEDINFCQAGVGLWPSAVLSSFFQRVWCSTERAIFCFVLQEAPIPGNETYDVPPSASNKIPSWLQKEVQQTEPQGAPVKGIPIVGNPLWWAIISPREDASFKGKPPYIVLSSNCLAKLLVSPGQLFLLHVVIKVLRCIVSYINFYLNVTVKMCTPCCLSRKCSKLGVCLRSAWQHVQCPQIGLDSCMAQLLFGTCLVMTRCHWRNTVLKIRFSLFMSVIYSLVSAGPLAIKKGTMAATRSWQLHWCEISDGHLRCFRQKKDASCVIELKLGDQLLTHGPERGRPFCFNIFVSERRALCLSAEIKQEMDDWMNVLIANRSSSLSSDQRLFYNTVPEFTALSPRPVVTRDEEAEVEGAGYYHDVQPDRSQLVRTESDNNYYPPDSIVQHVAKAPLEKAPPKPGSASLPPSYRREAGISPAPQGKSTQGGKVQEGYLQKRSGPSLWHRRYCFLQGTKLHVYSQKGSQQAIQVLSLVECGLDLSSKDSKNYAFKVST